MWKIFSPGHILEHSWRCSYITKNGFRNNWPQEVDLLMVWSLTCLFNFVMLHHDQWFFFQVNWGKISLSSGGGTTTKIRVQMWWKIFQLYIYIYIISNVPENKFCVTKYSLLTSIFSIFGEISGKNNARCDDRSVYFCSSELKAVIKFLSIHRISVLCNQRIIQTSLGSTG
jgi:hypothetical protein